MLLHCLGGSRQLLNATIAILEAIVESTGNVLVLLRAYANWNPSNNERVLFMVNG